jgi:hypothetical protein
MGLRSLFQRKVVKPASVASVPAGASLQNEPLSRELQKDLEAAWTELSEAAKISRVTNFHACTRTGQPWTEDPASVRAVAATLREFPLRDGKKTT